MFPKCVFRSLRPSPAVTPGFSGRQNVTLGYFGRRAAIKSRRVVSVVKIELLPLIVCLCWSDLRNALPRRRAGTCRAPRPHSTLQVVQQDAVKVSGQQGRRCKLPKTWQNPKSWLNWARVCLLTALKKTQSQLSGVKLKFPRALCIT